MERFNRIGNATLTENARKVLSEGQGSPADFNYERNIHDLQEFKDYIFNQQGHTSIIEFCHEAYDIDDIEDLYTEIINVLGEKVFTIAWLKFCNDAEDCLSVDTQEIVILDDNQHGYSLFAYTA